MWSPSPSAGRHEATLNAHHRALEFVVSEWVWLQLQHRSAASITEKSTGKLARYYGPFQIIERVGTVACRLQLPPKAQIHGVFHVVFLKKHVSVPPSDIVQLPPIRHGKVLPTPSNVTRARLNRGTWKLSVQWLGCDPADATWGQLTNFTTAYPEFQLDNKLFRNRGGNVVDTFVGRHYQCRRRMEKTQAAEKSG